MAQTDEPTIEVMFVFEHSTTFVKLGARINVKEKIRQARDSQQGFLTVEDVEDGTKHHFNLAQILRVTVIPPIIGGTDE